MRVLFAGTPDFAVPPLKALAQEHEIVGVYTQPDRRAGRGKKLTPPPVKVVAQELGINVYQPSTLKDQAHDIEELRADVMVVVAYGMLLPQSILDIPKLGCINIHASLLPRWRGAAPIHRAIEAGDNESGVSIMRMELGLDTGPVYQMLRTPILDTDTTASLHDKLAVLGAQGISETLAMLASTPNLQPIPQEDSQACYAKKLQKAEANIDWQSSAQDIHRAIRAFIPFPVAQCKHNDTRIRVWQARVEHNDQHNTSGNDLDNKSLSNKAKPGTVTNIDDTGITVQCGQGSLILEILQRDGSKAMPYSEFANGYGISINDQLS